jgi:glycosyltransferase involved in cell wall biosynthesis
LDKGLENDAVARKPLRIMLVGNHLSASTGTRGVGEDLADRFRALRWNVLTTSHKLQKMLRLPDMLRTAFLARSEYDVALVEVFSGKAFFWAEVVATVLHLLRKPLVLVLHGGGLLEFARRWPRRVERLLRPARAVVTPSRFLQDGLRAIRPDITYLPNGIYIQRYPFRARSKPAPQVCWFRALHAIYNPLMAVEAFSSLLGQFPGARLMMIGPDKGDGTLQTLWNRIHALKLESKVELTGAIPKAEVSKWLNMGDLFINTTNYESFGVAMVEAAACGLCIVSTNVGELPLLWQDGHDALLVQPDDAKAMAAAVRRILCEPGLAERLSRNARAKAEGFDWSRIIPQWERLLAEVAGIATRVSCAHNKRFE